VVFIKKINFFLHLKTKKFFGTGTGLEPGPVPKQGIYKGIELELKLKKFKKQFQNWNRFQIDFGRTFLSLIITLYKKINFSQNIFKNF